VKWSQVIPVTQFAPNADPTTPGTLTEIDNIIPSERGWRSAYSLTDAGMASLSATCVGAALCTLMDGSRVLIAGFSSGLRLRSAATWADRNGADSYKATEDLRWRFAQMGDYILAATCSNSIQVSASGATFTAVPSFAPQASLIESVYGFIFAADTNDATYGDQADRWWCSALFDHTSWTPDVATQATTGRLVSTPGPITGLRRLGTNIVAYKERSMYVGEYVEPPTVWDFNLISSDVGCPSHEAVVNLGRSHLFPGASNFYWFDGASVQPIPGAEAVREWFFDVELYNDYANRIQAAHDPAKGLIYWAYPRAGGSAMPARCVVYNYKMGRWGWADYGIECAVDYVASGLTYDGLGTFYSTYDAGIDRTYDSPLWVPDKVVPAVFDTSHVLRTIDGASASATFTTWHLGDDQQYNLLRRARVRWLTAPTLATMDLYTRDQHGGTFALRVGPVAESGNKFDALASARWHKVKISTTGDCEFSGIAVDLQPQGGW
jgi:hypothetical protein